MAGRAVKNRSFGLPSPPCVPATDYRDRKFFVSTLPLFFQLMSSCLR